MPKKAKAPKVSPEELLESLLQAEAERAAEEEERLRTKAALELKEYNQRRMLLVESVKFFRRLEKAASEQGRQRADRKEWTDFLSCRKSPDPASAPQLRECLFRWAYQQEARAKSSVSWTLAADERSPLTQDSSRKRNTRKDLNEAFRNIGGIYLPTVCEALSVLESIQDLAAGHHQGTTMGDEVAEARDEIRKFISDSLDRMTFRIGSNINRDMETLDPVMSDFHFRATNVLAVYLWSFRPVPLAADYNLLMKVIDIAPLNLVLHRPPALELKDCLIRGLWLEFDHYSNMDPTQTLPRLGTTPELIAAQEAEWGERQEVRRKRLTALRREREDYENEQRRQQAEAEALEAQKGGQKEPKPKGATEKAQGKRAKATNQAPAAPEPVPAVITDETEVDIDAEYERQESDRFWDDLDGVAPKSRPLREGYINLREYAIVGGLYKLARFERLPQPVELRSDFIYTNVPVGLQLTERVYRAVDGDELIKMELHLPAHCRWWEAPTVCCWEPWEESDQFARLQPEVQQFHLQYGELEAHKATLLFNAPVQTGDQAPSTGHREPKIVQDFSLTDIPVEVRLHYLIRDHLLPRLPERYRFRAELRRLYAILTERATRQKARDREQMARNGMMHKYDQFLLVSEQPDGATVTRLSEMRLPIDADIDVEGEPDDGAHCSWMPCAAEMDEKLPQFSLPPPDAARYLHPPAQSCPSLIVGRSATSSDTDGTEREQEMEALVRTMEGCDAMLDDNSDERLCESLSIFLELLEYLREKEKPMFPARPVAGEEKPDGQVLLMAMPERKEPTRRGIHFRTTKKHPFGLGPRPPRSVSVSGMGATALSVEEKKRRRRRKSQEQPKRVLDHIDRRPVDPVRSDDVPELIEHEPGRWSTKPIRSQSYDPDQRLLTFYTDRLGTYGLAARKYCNLPFQYWDIRRHGRVAQLTTAITVSTEWLRIVFYVTSQGYRVELLEHRQRAAKKHEEPVPDTMPTVGLFSLEELEKFLHKINVHVFPQVDTCFYIPRLEAASAPKHQPMESHNLRCLGVFCMTHNFQSCLWNRYANRRTSLVLSRELIEGRHEPEFRTVMITPLKSQYVEVEELCSPSLEEVLLAFHPRPVEQSYNADCYGLLKDGMEEPSRKVLTKTPPTLQWNVGQLVQRLRLLSYS